MLRVCHLITSLATGGAETALFRLVTATDRRKQEQVVISLTDEGVYGPRLREAGISVFALGMQRGRFSLSAFLRLVRLLRQQKPDVIQTWLYHADLLGLLAGGIAGIRRIAWNIRCSVTDERYVRGQAGVVLRLLALLSPIPRAVVSNSTAGQRVHTSLGYRPRQWRIIPNGLDIATFRPDPTAYRDMRVELGVPPETLLVGLVARYDPLKDYPTFLQTAVRVIRRRRDVHFVAVGSGVSPANKDLARLLRHLAISDRVHLLGERRDTPRLNAAFDVAMCTSTGEGFPNVLIEAMSCGVPCVSTDVGDAAVVIADTGLVAPAADPDKLAEAVLQLVETDPVRRHARGAAARQRVQEHYSLPIMVAHYQALYDSLIG